MSTPVTIRNALNTETTRQAATPLHTASQENNINDDQLHSEQHIQQNFSFHATQLHR